MPFEEKRKEAQKPLFLKKVRAITLNNFAHAGTQPQIVRSFNGGFFIFVYCSREMRFVQRKRK
jgi:hypothetical protein